LGLPKSKHRGPTVKIVTAPTSENFRESNNALLLTFPGGPVTVSSDEEWITSTSRSKTTRNRSNMCVHRRLLTTYSGDPSTRERMTHHPLNDPGNNNYYLWAIHHLTSQSAHASACASAKAAFPVSFGPAFLSTNAVGYINTALAELGPDLTQMSLPNFLYEFDQLKDLVPTWKTAIHTVKAATKYYWANPNLIVRGLANKHLAYKFGIAPLVGDIAASLSILTSTQKEISLWRKSVGQLFHRSKVMLTSEHQVSGTSTYSSEALTTWKGTLKRTVTAHIVYSALPIVAINELDIWIRGYLDAFGVELNPGLIYDAIRFTFVLDWFSSLGDFISRFKIDALELPINMVDSYLQYKEEFVCESSTQVCYGRSDFAPWLRSGGWVTTEKSFQRMPIFPGTDTFESLHWKTPTINQAILGISLGAVLGIKR